MGVIAATVSAEYGLPFTRTTSVTRFAKVSICTIQITFTCSTIRIPEMTERT